MARPSKRDKSAKGRQKADDTPDRARSRSQVEIILREFDDVAVGYARSPEEVPDADRDVADFAYLYRKAHILVRDRDLDRVLAVLRDQDPEIGARTAHAMVNGITRLELETDRDVLDVLDLLDGRVGRGVATPDHVLWVTPTGTACPATEPELPPTLAPYPPPNGRPLDGSGVMVSVVDTGWHSPAATNPHTPWLQDVVGDEESINTKDIHAYAGHGTFIAGVVRCEAPAVDIRVEGFLTKGGAIYESEIVTQLCEALALGPDIISLSAGMTTRDGLPSLSFEVFHDHYLSKVKGTVLVAAAGNDSTRRPFWPAAFPWTVSVGAVRADGERAAFSNFGSWVDVYALGVDIVNAFPNGTYVTKEAPVGQTRVFKDGMALWSGTSFSTPIVAGKIAARMSRTGLNARQAADELLTEARANAIVGVGAIL
jgi:hypothetical protein